MTFTRTTDATTEPVSLEEAKTQLRIDGSYEDAQIRRLMKTARQQMEKYAERSFISQTWTGNYDKFPRIFSLPYGPVIGVTHIKYYTDDVLTTLAKENYRVDINSTIARVEPVNSWPSTDTRINTVEIVYTAGFTTVPEQVKEAILAQLTFLYQHRGDGNQEFSALARNIIHDFKSYAWQ